MLVIADKCHVMIAVTSVTGLTCEYITIILVHQW